MTDAQAKTFVLEKLLRPIREVWTVGLVLQDGDGAPLSFYTWGAVNGRLDRNMRGPNDELFVHVDDSYKSPWKRSLAEICNTREEAEAAASKRRQAGQESLIGLV